jgi:acetate---CoA ligase (ADP-forming)
VHLDEHIRVPGNRPGPFDRNEHIGLTWLTDFNGNHTLSFWLIEWEIRSRHGVTGCGVYEELFSYRARYNAARLEACQLSHTRTVQASTSRDALSYALDPRSIAVIGASEHVNKVGGRPIAYLRRFGFAGAIYPINPTRETVQGLRAYGELTSLPEVPDLAIIATPGHLVATSIDACASVGVKVTIVMASGFGETADADSIRAEHEMVARARVAGMRIIGPNCQGLANFATGTIASFSTILGEVEPADGAVAIVSQSGVMSAVPYGLLRARGIGVRHAHSTGNDADVTLSELALAVIKDPSVRLLLLYIEAIRDPDNLALTAGLAHERDVPVIAVKSGRTVRGQAAARSHTGAMATEDRVVDAFFRSHGIWRARDVHELVSGADLYLREWRPRGRGMVAVSNSGATCVMAADLAEEVKLELPALAPQTTARLAARLPSFATVTNPIDLTAALLTDSTLFGEVLTTVAKDPATDLLFVGMSVAGEGYDVEAFARDAAILAAGEKPIAVAAPQDSVAAKFRAAGIPTFANQTEAVRLLAQLVDHTTLMRRSRPETQALDTVDVPTGESRFLSEFESLAFLQQHGLPTVPSRLCHSMEDARSAASALGFPVVLKACSPGIPHKSDLGLVMVGIDSEAAVTRAFDCLHDRLGRINVVADGILVAPVIKGRREMMLGARVDPTFGPVVLVGDGGKYVEALGDFTVLMPPFTEGDVHQALLSLRIAPVLRGVRGEPPLDLTPLCDAALRLGQLITAAAHQIVSIDINPAIVSAAGEPFTIVDALVERANRAS